MRLFHLVYKKFTTNTWAGNYDDLDSVAGQLFNE